MFNYIELLCLFLIQYLFLYVVIRKFAESLSDSIWIFSLSFWHFFCSILSILYVYSSGGDAVHYYEASFESAYGWKDIFYPNKNLFAVVKSLRFFVGDNFIYISLIFSLVGNLTLIKLFRFIKESFHGQSNSAIIPKHLAILFLFTPGLSLWSSLPGKDSLVLLAITLLIIEVLDDKRKDFVIILLAILLLVSYRSYLLLLLAPTILFLSLGVIKKLFWRITHIRPSFFFDVFWLFLLFIIFMLSGGLNFAHDILNTYHFSFDTISLETWQYFVDERVAAYRNAGQLDYSNESAMAMAANYFGLSVSFKSSSLLVFLYNIESYLLFFIFLCLFFTKPSRPFLSVRISRIIVFFNLMFMSTVLVSTTFNFGLAARQKWMIFLPLFILLISRGR